MSFVIAKKTNQFVYCECPFDLMKTKGFPLKKQFGGRWDKECKQWVIPMKNFPQLAKYLRTEKISIEDNTQTAFKNYNPELSFDQCEQLYCDDMSSQASCHQSCYCTSELLLLLLYRVVTTLTNLSDSDSDHDFRLSNDDIEKIQKYASKQSKANDEISKDYYGHKIDEMCRKLQSQKDKMLFKKSKTIESTSPIKSTKNEMELDWSAQDHACKSE